MDIGSEFLKQSSLRFGRSFDCINHAVRQLVIINNDEEVTDEVRAWTIPRGTPALEAAGAVHPDMMKGFIRVEVVSYESLKASGSYAEAKKSTGRKGIRGAGWGRNPVSVQCING